MAVISVKEELERSEAEFSTTDATSVRIFTVEFDTADDPRIRPQLACSAAGIPLIWSLHPFNPWLYCRGKRTFARGPFLFEVVASYVVKSYRADEAKPGTTPFQSPFDEPWEIEWFPIASNEQVDRDIYGNPIVNSAGQSFDPPITKDCYDLGLRIVRNQPSYNKAQAADYVGAVNSDYFYGFAPYLVKCTNYSSRTMYSAITYYQITYEFHIRLLADPITGNYHGWARRVMDEGLMYKTTVEGQTVYKKVKTGDNEDVPQLVRLNGSGGAVPAGSTDAYFLYFALCKMRPFSALGL